MNTVHEYRVPLFIGAGTLVVILVVWVALISPQNTKLSNLQAQEAQLQTQQTGLQTKLARSGPSSNGSRAAAPTSRRSARRSPVSRARPTSMPRSPRSRASSTH